MLYAYFRLGKRLTTRAAKLVTKNLRMASLHPEHEQLEEQQSPSMLLESNEGAGQLSTETEEAGHIVSFKASSQIKEVLETIMTLKVIDESMLELIS